MELSKKDLEKLALGIQAAIGIAAAILAIRGSTKAKSRRMRKAMDKEAKQLEKLHRLQYRLERKALKQRYRRKIRKK